MMRMMLGRAWRLWERRARRSNKVKGRVRMVGKPKRARVRAGLGSGSV